MRSGVGECGSEQGLRKWRRSFAAGLAGWPRCPWVRRTAITCRCYTTWGAPQRAPGAWWGQGHDRRPARVGGFSCITALCLPALPRPQGFSSKKVKRVSSPCLAVQLPPWKRVSNPAQPKHRCLYVKRRRKMLVPRNKEQARCHGSRLHGREGPCCGERHWAWGRLAGAQGLQP